MGEREPLGYVFYGTVIDGTGAEPLRDGAVVAQRRTCRKLNGTRTIVESNCRAVPSCPALSTPICTSPSARPALRRSWHSIHQ